MEEDFFDPDFLLPYIRPDRLSTDAFQRISELSKLKIPRHFLKKYLKTHFRATISKAQLKNFKDGLYQIPTSPPAESPTTSDMGDVVNVEEWSSANSPNEEPQAGPMETQDIGQTEVRTSACTQCIKNITDEALVDALDKANGEQLTRLAVPRLGSRLSLWQLLTLHCKVGETPDAVITLLLEEFVKFVKYVQDFLRRQLDRSGLESPPFSAQESLWGQQKTAPSYFDSSRIQKSPWRPRSFHRPFQDEGSRKSASQKNFFVPVTGGLVQIETADQAAILGLPRGRYRMRLPPDFVKQPSTLPPPRPSPAKLSRADFASSTTSRQPASFLPATDAGCFSSPSPSVEVNGPTARATPLPPAPLSSTQPMAFENEPPASGSFAPTTLPVADQLLTPAQSTPQADAESPATTRSSTVLKHRFYLLPGHKKPLELPLTETGKTVSSTTPNAPPPVPLNEPSPEPVEPPPKSVVTSNPKTPPPPPSSKSRSKPCPVISEPPAADPPISKPLSSPSPQLRILDRDSGEPIPNEWISSGGLQPLVLDPGSPSTSLLESASGGISHTTGSLVSCAPPTSSPLPLPPPPPPLLTLTSTTPAVDASSTAAATTTATISSVLSISPPPLPVGDSPVTNGSAATAQPTSSPQPPHKRLCTRDSPPPSYSPPPIISLPRPPAKLESLDEPVLEIERISDSRVVVTRADGARFMVEDGGDGLTQATIETILQLNG